MNLKDKLAQLYAEGRALAEKSEKDGLSEVDEKRWGDLKGEIESTRAALETQEVREKDAVAFRSGDAHYNQGTGAAARAVTLEIRAEAAANGNGKETPDTRSLSDRFLDSEGWQKFKERRFAKGMNTGSVEAGSFFHRAAHAPLDVTGLGAEELRTLIYTGAVPSAPAFVAPNRLPGVYTPDLPQLNARSAFLNLQTNSPVVQFFRELLFTNNAAFVSEAVATGSNSGLKPESALTFESDSVIAETLAHWIPVTNQMLEDEPQLRGIIEGRLLDGLRLAEDDAIINGSGVSPQIEGLLTVSGTQSADGAYFGGAPVENAGAAWEDFDRITRARRLVRVVGRARPSFVMLSPADLERLVTITDSTGQYYSGSPFGDTALARMRGLQVIETEALDEGQFIVGDGRMAAVFDRMAAAITAGWIDQQFVRNMMTLLAEERIAFAVFRPTAFVIGDLTSASA